MRNKWEVHWEIHWEILWEVHWQSCTGPLPCYPCLLDVPSSSEKYSEEYTEKYSEEYTEKYNEKHSEKYTENALKNTLLKLHRATSLLPPVSHPAPSFLCPLRNRVRNTLRNTLWNTVRNTLTKMHWATSPPTTLPPRTFALFIGASPGLNMILVTLVLLTWKS